MKYLIENYFLTTWPSTKIQSGPSVLIVEDLKFGFNIWLGFCCISCLAFAGEFLLNIQCQAKPQKIKFEKVHPLVMTGNNNYEVSQKTLEKFRINRKRTNVVNIEKTTTKS
jgi:hypothetical protein